MGKRKEKINQAKALISQYDMSRLIEQARSMSRRFILHIGPTNSGKTYQSLCALKEAESGVYLGPLRLMALEVFDKLNMDGVPCTLLTGEEYEPIPGAKITASTVELCNYETEYDVAIIDEAQMVKDTSRGAQWTKAILCVNAKVVHICMAPEAEQIIVNVLKDIDAPYEIVRHDRLTPLQFTGKLKHLSDVQDGDALIVFSRRTVLSLAADLEKLHKRVSVIYGALPPASRKEEVRKFESGETTIVVATDAIGMGISLPIKRVIFCSTKKYDGTEVRFLKPDEVQQIAGRAGRFGIHDKGEVLSMENVESIEHLLARKVAPISSLSIPFPTEVLHSKFSMSELLDGWNALAREMPLLRKKMIDARLMLDRIVRFTEGVPKTLQYQLLTCPVDAGSEALLDYWAECCRVIIANEEVPLPDFGDYSLETCELQYKAYDIRHQLLRRIGVEEPHLQEKTELIERINLFLSQGKGKYANKCSRCGKVLPFNYQFGMCKKCYDKLIWERQNREYFW